MAYISKSVLAVILGGGAGTRLFPLTDARSKPAVPIGGKYRIVDIPISNCINSDITRMFVLTQYNSASLNQHIKNTYHFSIFSSAFVDILAAEQTPDNKTWFQGTADAVRQSLRHINNHQFDYVLILSGDQLYQMDFKEMLKKHIDSEAEISIATIPVGKRDAPEFGIMKVNEEDLITSFIEKPHKDLLPEWESDTGEEMKNEGRIYLASMGIYIFNRDLLFDILLREKPNATDFGKEIMPGSINKHKVASYQYNGYWTDIGNIYSFYEANLGLTNEIPQFNLFDSSKSIYSRPRMLPPAKISGTTLNKTVIAEGCIIHGEKIEGSVIGIRTRIGKGTIIKDSYIMGADYFEKIDQMEIARKNKVPLVGIGEKCHIENAIIDKNCRIGDNVKLVGGAHLPDTETSLFTVKEGIIVVKKNAIIPDGFSL